MLTGGNLPSFSAPSKAHSSQLLLPHSHPRRLSESSCTETTCSFSTVCITLPQKRDKVNRNSSCLIRFLQKSLTISCQLFYTTPTFFIPHQRSAAPVSAPASAGAGRSPLGAAPGAAGVTKSFCPCRKTGGNTGFSPVSFLHVLHGYVVRVGLKSGFSHLVFAVPNRPHPLQRPKRTRFRLFRALPGALRSFYPLLIREIPRIFPLSLALEMIQDSVEHLNSGFRSRGGKRGKLRFFCRVAQMDHPFFPCRFWEPR